MFAFKSQKFKCPFSIIKSAVFNDGSDLMTSLLEFCSCLFLVGYLNTHRYKIRRFIVLLSPLHIVLFIVEKATSRPPAMPAVCEGDL